MAFQTEPLMEIVGRKIAADLSEQRGNGPLVILFTHNGDIHYVDRVSGEIKWTRETGTVSYQAYQDHGVTRYVDIGAEDESPSYHQPGSGPTQVIPGETIDEMHKWIKFLCQGDAKICANEDMYQINHLTGKDDEVVGPDTLLIKRTDWSIRSTDDQLWFVRYSNIVASFQSDINLKCLVYYARTAEKIMELSEKFALLKVPGGGILARTCNSMKRIRLANPLYKFVENKDYILHLDGYLESDEVNDTVFLKKVPKMEKKFLRTKHVYKEFSGFRYVIRKLLVESDDKYQYIAFEKMEGTLADRVKKLSQISSSDIKILRNVLEAVLELHEGNVLHRNICPENVLVTASKGGDFIVKLCGMCSNIKCQRPVMGSKWYMLERHKLARLILNYMTRGKHSFKDNDIPSDYLFKGYSKSRIKREFGQDFTVAGSIAADLVEKLMDSNSDLTLSMLYYHVLFWDMYEKLNFLKDVSEELLAGSLPDIEYLAGEVFTGEWKVEEPWLTEMSKVPEETREMKKAFKEMKLSEREKGHGTEEVIQATEEMNFSEQDTDDHSKDEPPVYDTQKLKDLLRLIRNSLTHPCGVYPNNNKVSLATYVFKHFPTLVIQAYNHVLNKGKDTKVYAQYITRLKD